MVTLSINDLIELYKMASIGKLAGGLIHNLNGPMQNLGLAIEIAHLSIKNESKWDKSTAQNILSRLKRMEEEHEKINSLIKTTSTRTIENIEPDNPFLNIYEFLKQEIIYLHTNLYFKHNVHTEITNVNNPPLISSLPKDSLMALGWLLQGLVEDIERQKLEGLAVKIISDDSNLKIIFSTQGGRLSEGFLSQFTDDKSSTDIFKSDTMDLGIFLLLNIFRSNGIKLESETGSSSSSLRIIFP